MIREVLLQINGRRGYLPPSLPARILAKDFPYNRIGSVISAIKEEGLINQTSIKKYEYKEIIKNPDVLYGFSDKKDYYAIYDKVGEEVVTYRIIKVDTDTPWTIGIKRSGYGEYIKVFDSDDCVEIIDEELNYGRKSKMD